MGTQRVSATSQDFLLVARQIAGFDSQNLMGKDHCLTLVLEAGIACGVCQRSWEGIS